MLDAFVVQKQWPITSRIHSCLQEINNDSEPQHSCTTAHRRHDIAEASTAHQPTKQPNKIDRYKH